MSNTTINEKNLPLIKCLPREDFAGGLKFWCPYCKQWHLHGRGDGHRSTHCQPDSPWADGYIIKMMSKVELRQLMKAIRDYLEAGDT